MMDINYLGSVLLTRAVLPSLMRQKQGRIVLVSSMAGQLGLFGYTAYSASKFALRGMAESLQMEVRVGVGMFLMSLHVLVLKDDLLTDSNILKKASV